MGKIKKIQFFRPEIEVISLKPFMSRMLLLKKWRLFYMEQKVLLMAKINGSEYRMKSVKIHCIICPKFIFKKGDPQECQT